MCDWMSNDIPARLHVLLLPDNSAGGSHFTDVRCRRGKQKWVFRTLCDAGVCAPTPD